MTGLSRVERPPVPELITSTRGKGRRLAEAEKDRALELCRSGWLSAEGQGLWPVAGAAGPRHSVTCGKMPCVCLLVPALPHL